MQARGEQASDLQKPYLSSLDSIGPSYGRLGTIQGFSRELMYTDLGFGKIAPACRVEKRFGEAGG